LQCYDAVCCSVLQCYDAVCCSVLQCVAVNYIKTREATNTCSV